MYVLSVCFLDCNRGSQSMEPLQLMPLTFAAPVSALTIESREVFVVLFHSWPIDRARTRLAAEQMVRS